MRKQAHSIGRAGGRMMSDPPPLASRHRYRPERAGEVSSPNAYRPGAGHKIQLGHGRIERPLAATQEEDAGEDQRDAVGHDAPPESSCVPREPPGAFRCRLVVAQVAA